MELLRSFFLLLLLKAAITSCEICDVQSAVLVTSIKAIKEHTNSSVGIYAELSPGVEYVEYSGTSVAPHSVCIIGNNSTIRCNESTALPLSDYSNFPLIFRKTLSVQILNVTFENCLRALQFQQVGEVELINCTFRNFTDGGAVEISNSPLVSVESCTFDNNTSLGIATRKFSGNAGGLSIGYDASPRLDTLKNILPEISIVKSEFIGNNADAAEAYQYPLVEYIRSNLYNQRGGGIAIYSAASNYSANIIISDCVLQDNYARNVGGGVYVFFGGNNSSHKITIEKSQLFNNRAAYVAGVALSMDTDDSVDNPNQIYISDCIIHGNRARVLGGGITVFQSSANGNLNNVTVTNTSFVDNFAEIGSAVYLQTTFTTRNIQRRNRIVLEKCTFNRNKGERGIVFLIRNTASFYDISFQQNTGPSIRALDALVLFGGNITFADNGIVQGGLSGALRLSSFAQVLLLRGVNMLFYNNTGSIGASIVVNTPNTDAAFLPQLYNPRCFLQYEDPTSPPSEWKVQMVFENNSAVVGPVVYASHLFECFWYSLESPFFSTEYTFFWSFMDVRNNFILRQNVYNNDSQVLENVADYYVQTEVFSIVLEDDTYLYGFPGEIFQLQAAALDEFGHNTTAFLEISQYNGKVSKFLPSILPSVAGIGTLSFTYYSSVANYTTFGYVRASFINTDQVSPANFTLQHLECWPGYVLRSDLRNEQCVCEETDEVASCIADRSGILLSEGLWGAPPSWSMTLVTFACPIGYCNCTGYGEVSEGCLFLYSEPFPICQEDRTGLLCGECRENYSVGMLTNQCRPFAMSVPQYYWLIPLYVLIVIPLLVCIVRFSIHLPTVFRSFIFYMQISPIATEYITNFRLGTDVMYCLSSTMALYVPYDFTLHDGLTALESYGLRYLALLLALIVVPIAARIRYHTKFWNGIWTVILLMYVMVVHTSVSLLHCAKLTRPDGDSITIWFFDGSVKCFEDVHILLTIIALISLAFVGLLIPVVAFVVHYHSIRNKVSKLPEKFEACEQAFTRGMRNECKWWPVFELSCRFVFVIAVILSAGNMVVPLILSIVILCTHTFVKPYTSRIANYTEIAVLLILVILLSLGNVNELKEIRSDNFTLWPIFFLPVIAAAVYAVIYATYFVWMWVKQHRENLKQLFKRERTTTQITLRSLSTAKKANNVTKTTVSLSDNLDDDAHVQLVSSSAF